MNLFEAKHILQSVGYSVNKDYVGEACALLESAIRRLPGKMISEMSKARADKAKSMKVAHADLVARVEQDMASIDSKKSNFETGKAKTSQMANAGEYLSNFELLNDVADELDAFGLETLNNFKNDGYLAACEENDATLVKKADKGNGAGDGGNYATAIANGDVKRALTVILNRIRSGFASEEAKQRALAALDEIAAMDGAESVIARIDSAREKLGALELGARARRAADTYTATLVDGINPKLVVAMIKKAGIGDDAITMGEDSVTFAAPAGKAAKATELLAARGIEVAKNERVAAAGGAGAQETQTIIVDDVEIAEVGLEDVKINYTIGEDGEITLTGTAKQIAKAIAEIEAVGAEIIG